MKFVTSWQNPAGFFCNEEIVWVDGNLTRQRRAPVPFADITWVAPTPVGVEGEIIEDRQDGSRLLFTASLHVVKDQKFIVLSGNGWGDVLGYPYNQDIGYPVIGGKTCEKMIQKAKQGNLGRWDNVFSGNMGDLYVPPKQIELR